MTWISKSSAIHHSEAQGGLVRHHKEGYGRWRDGRACRIVIAYNLPVVLWRSATGSVVRL